MKPEIIYAKRPRLFTDPIELRERSEWIRPSKSPEEIRDGLIRRLVASIEADARRANR